MKCELAIAALVAIASAREVPTYTGNVLKREVPLEHSHQPILDATNTQLQKNNPLKIQDAVFALLGNAAAAAGAPNVKNLDCLQQIVADQAFTNAKAAGDVDGQANAIMFRALERNTGAVGQASVLCNETATNPEIAAITQHQDPASSAASGNKDIALAVAKQLASIGADPNLAIKTGTFAPGKIGDPTAKGNTCDDANDKNGCIFTLNLLVPDVTEDEIKAAVAGISAGSSSSNSTASSASASSSKGSSKGSSCASKRRRARALKARAATNVQTFTGALGGAPPPVLFTAGAERAFSVNGDTFVNKGAALQRSCSVQHNTCANAANSKAIAGGVAQCETQETACNTAASA